MIEIIAALLMLIASIGLVRMPDLYLRTSATSKSSTLGIALIMLGAILFFRDREVTLLAVSVFFFIMLTAPIAAHLVGRIAYHRGVPLWEGSVVDEWKEKK